MALLTRWPFVFEPLGLFSHAEKLLGFNVPDTMRES
jgi:hypothetical protein